MLVSLEDGAASLGSLTEGDQIEALELALDKEDGPSPIVRAVRFGAGWVRTWVDNHGTRTEQLRKLDLPLTAAVDSGKLR